MMMENGVLSFAYYMYLDCAINNIYHHINELSGQTKHLNS